MYSSMMNLNINSMEKTIKKPKQRHLDMAAVGFGFIALVSNIFIDCKWLNDILCIAAGTIWVVYLVCAIKMIWKNQPKMDWILGNGHFLRKVVAFVILFPFFVTTITMFCIWMGDLFCGCDYSPKNLIFEDNLYTGKLGAYDHAEQTDPSIFWTIYYHFIDPGNQHMSTSASGRKLAALMGIMGVFLLNGILVSSIVGWIDSRREKWLKGEVRYKRFLKNNPHYVIIGGHDSVAGIVKQLLDKQKEDSKQKDAKQIPDGQKYILIQTSCDVEEFRRELFSNLKAVDQQRIIIYYGNRTSEKDIRSLRLETAIEVYILGEEIRNDDIESFHDTRNMEALHLAYDYLKESDKFRDDLLLRENIKKEITALKKKQAETKADVKAEIKRLEGELEPVEKNLKTKSISFRVMFEYQTSFSVFQFSEISDDIKYCINFKPFNYYEMWAQKVLINKNLKLVQNSTAATDKISYLPLEGTEGIGPDSDKYVHLFIVGMSRMGVVLGIEAAHLAHYPNFATKHIRTKISFIDKNSADEKDFFMGRFKELFDLSHWRYGAVAQTDETGVKAGELQWKPADSHAPEGYDYLGGDFLDIEWEFINGGIENKSVKDYILKEVSRENCLATIAMCLPEPSRCLAAALYLGRDIYDHAKQVLVYNRYGDSLISEMTNHHKGKHINPYDNKLKAFGMAAECYDENIISDAEKIAATFDAEYNNIYKKYEKLYGKRDEGENPGKSSVAKWWSNIYCANTLWTKLRCLQWKEDKPLSTTDKYYLSNVEHARWNMEQLLMGYRPLTEAEQKDVIADLTQKNPKKLELGHFNICSFERLKEIDRSSIRFDWGFSKLLPEIYGDLKVKDKTNTNAQ